MTLSGISTEKLRCSQSGGAVRTTASQKSRKILPTSASMPEPACHTFASTFGTVYPFGKPFHIPYQSQPYALDKQHAPNQFWGTRCALRTVYRAHDIIRMAAISDARSPYAKAGSINAAPSAGASRGSTGTCEKHPGRSILWKNEPALNPARKYSKITERFGYSTRVRQKSSTYEITDRR